MKQRTFLWVFLSFLLGMGIAWGLVVLDRQASIPRLERTDIFEVVTSDGTVRRLSYAEIEREQEALRARRELPSENRRAVPKDWKPGEPLRLTPPPDLPTGEDIPEQVAAKKPGDRNLKDLFARIFSQPIMQDLMQAQVAREAGELADVLDLTDEQLAAVEKEIRKRKRPFAPGTPGSPSGAEQEAQEPETTLQEELQTILTPEQYQRYEEYTEKKRALARSPALDRQVFELSWRLNLTEEQEAPVREILKEQGEKRSQISPAPPTAEGDTSPADRLQVHLENRTALNKETAERMKGVLEEDQYQAFLQYQVERDTETRLLKRLIQEERAGEAPATP
jgi:hypothetical protein